MNARAPLQLMPLAVTTLPSATESKSDGPSRGRRWGWVLVAVLAIAALTRTTVTDGNPVRPDSRSQEVRTVGSLATIPSRGGRAFVRISGNSPLVDGTIVEVIGTGFAPGAEVELRQCAGKSPCVRLEPVETTGSEGSYRSSFIADSSGTFDARLALHRYVLVALRDRPIDCSDLADSGGCDLVTVVYFSGRSQYPPRIPLRFAADGAPPTRPVVVAEATSGLSESQRVRVAGVGFAPGTRVRPAMCAAATQDHCEPLGVEGPDIVGDDSIVILTVVVNERRGDLDCRTPHTCMITLLPEQSGGRSIPAGLPVSFIP